MRAVDYDLGKNYKHIKRWYDRVMEIPEVKYMSDEAVELLKIFKDMKEPNDIPKL
jgi:hypothetical protein